MAPGLGTALGQGLVQGYEESQDRRALQNAMQGLPKDASPRDILQAMVGLNVSPEAKQTALKNLMGAAEFEEKKRQFGEEARLREKQIDVNKAALDQKGNEPKLSPFQKTLQNKQAEEYIKLDKDISEISANLDTLDKVQALSDEHGLVGIGTSAIGISKTGPEMEALSFPLIQPIVKMFNPVGPIAVKKLEFVKDKYQVKGTDLPWVRDSKIRALRAFSNQALTRSQQKKQLIEQYNGLIPKEIEQQFDKETEAFVDSMIDLHIQGEKVDDKALGLPSAESFKNKTITAPDGSKFYSNGTEWLRK